MIDIGQPTITDSLVRSMILEEQFRLIGLFDSVQIPSEFVWALFDICWFTLSEEDRNAFNTYLVIVFTLRKVEIKPALDCEQDNRDKIGRERLNKEVV